MRFATKSVLAACGVAACAVLWRAVTALPLAPLGQSATNDGTPSSTGEEALRAKVAERLQEQGQAHWVEFAVIVASANVLLGVNLFGKILELPRNTPVFVKALPVGIVVASLLCAMLAYYSIQVGALLVFGRLRFRQVALAFGIAGAQLSLFLWPAFVIQQFRLEGADSLGRLVTILARFLRCFRNCCLGGECTRGNFAANRRCSALQ
jgi:hypothetical protein